VTDDKFSLLTYVIAIAFIFAELLQFSTHAFPFLFYECCYHETLQITATKPESNRKDWKSYIKRNTSAFA